MRYVVAVDILIDRVTALAEEVGKMKERYATFQDMLEDDDEGGGLLEGFESVGMVSVLMTLEQQEQWLKMVEAGVL